ncbi:TetR family transcriptional regulator [Streptomyces lunaelactis]|uniref:TetR family transcriptional regulator n=2 Tax=Streptomyces lunaelactis TaxID=1535768 RepID=A0A2R4SXI2_9ACTN|nr:TetR family transcriptional regulator [Streptomyces lunaelactis]NUK84089.1 TetR family transcriptional regulator C-terminal domain-containing protein [Streptomyces lunaelactis]
MPRPANPLVRESLLDAGMTLFHARGFNAVGIKEITDTAGVPKGSFYSYYSSKNVFAAAVLDRFWTGIVRHHGPILTDPSTPPVRRLVAFFEALTRDNAERGFALGCLLGNLALELSDDNGEARLRLANIMEQWSDLIAACLAQAGNTADDGVATTETTDLASMIIESWEGAVMRGRVDQSRAPYDRFLTVSLPRLLDAVGVSV